MPLPGFCLRGVFAGCIAWFECQTRHRYDGGDHLILVGAVDRFEQRPGQELLYFAGQYGTAAPL